VHVLFQPHRYTRTRDLMGEFAAAFGDADSVEVLDIYAASEDPIAGIDGQSFARTIQRSHPGRVRYAATISAAVKALADEARPGDAVVTLGAGNVSQAAPLLLEALNQAAHTL
jgi:UDP-N-acetylmuramate--alanine ligase